MDQAGEVVRMLLQVLIKLVELFIVFMIQAFTLVLQFAGAVADMIR